MANAPISNARVWARSLLLLPLFGACASFGAPGPVVADRPGYTDTPTALPARAIQLEAGATDDRVGATLGAPRTEYRTAGEVLLRVGVGGRTEVRLFANSYATRLTDGAASVSGPEDVKIGAKLNLRAVPDSLHAWLPNAALLAATTLATGANGITAGVAQPEVKLAVSWTTPSPYSLYVNVGYGAIETSAVATRAWTSVANWWSVNPRVSLFAEGLAIGRVSGSGPGTSGEDVDAGITYLITDRLQIDFRGGRGLGSETSHERFVGVGFARRW